MGVNSLPKTVTRQRWDCDLNPGPSAPQSSTLTTAATEPPITAWFQLYTAARPHVPMVFFKTQWSPTTQHRVCRRDVSCLSSKGVKRLRYKIYKHSATVTYPYFDRRLSQQMYNGRSIPYRMGPNFWLAHHRQSTQWRSNAIQSRSYVHSTYFRNA